MADAIPKKTIPELVSTTSLDPNDYLVSHAATGSGTVAKKITNLDFRQSTPDGTEAEPSLAFAGTTTGFYRENGEIGASYLGTNKFKIGDSFKLNTGMSESAKSVTADYSVTINDGVMFCDASGSVSDRIVLTLPTIASVPTGQKYTFQKNDTSSKLIDIRGNGSELIGESSSKLLSEFGEFLSVYSDGTKWVVSNEIKIDSNIIEVGPYSKNIRYRTDGTADNVQIQNAIDDLAAKNGGFVKTLPNHQYNIEVGLNIPKDPVIQITSDFIGKASGAAASGKKFGGSRFYVPTGLSNPPTYIINVEGTRPAVTDNTDHSHVFVLYGIILDGTGLAKGGVGENAAIGLRLINTDHIFQFYCRTVAVEYAIYSVLDGDISITDYVGGMHCVGNNYAATKVNIYLANATQCWFDRNWFLGNPQRHFYFYASNKLRVTQNEFNLTTEEPFYFADGPTSKEACGEIIFAGNWGVINPAKNAWLDVRTNTDSKRIIIKPEANAWAASISQFPLLFNQDKEFYQITTTAATYTVKHYEDTILCNSGTNAQTITLPLALTATRPVTIKNILFTNPITINTTGGDLIESGTTLASSYAMAQLYESVQFIPDGNKWRAKFKYLPVVGGGSTIAPEDITEVSTNYTMTAVGDDHLLVSSYNTTISITLPPRNATFGSPNRYVDSPYRKTIKVTVLNLGPSGQVTILANGADEIDNAGQNSVVVSSAKTIEFIANTGARWRSTNYSKYD